MVRPLAAATLWFRRWVIWGPMTIGAYTFVCSCLILYGVTRRPSRALRAFQPAPDAELSPAGSQPALAEAAD